MILYWPDGKPNKVEYLVFDADGTAAIKEHFNDFASKIGENQINFIQLNMAGDDIAKVKIPNAIKKYTQKQIEFSYCNGSDVPENMEEFDLVIHCGACMFNSTYVVSRQNQAQKSNVPMTNYGIAIAYMSGIVDKILLPW